MLYSTPNLKSSDILNHAYLDLRKRENGKHIKIKPEKKSSLDPLFWLFFWLTLILILVACIGVVRASELPNNLYMGLIAEDTGGDYEVYLAIASVVRNRINSGDWHGLVALKRQNLSQFVKQNCDYVMKTKGIDLTKLATKAIGEICAGKDCANGATNYEHTGVYPIPYWAKNMQVAKVLYKGTKKEITFYKKRLAKR